MTVPILVTLPGILILSSDVQFAKALSAMVVTVYSVPLYVIFSGIATETGNEE